MVKEAELWFYEITAILRSRVSFLIGCTEESGILIGWLCLAMQCWMHYRRRNGHAKWDGLWGTLAMQCGVSTGDIGHAMWGWAMGDIGHEMWDGSRETLALRSGTGYG